MRGLLDVSIPNTVWSVAFYRGRVGVTERIPLQQNLLEALNPFGDDSLFRREPFSRDLPHSLPERCLPGVSRREGTTSTNRELKTMGQMRCLGLQNLSFMQFPYQIQFGGPLSNKKLLLILSTISTSLVLKKTR